MLSGLRRVAGRTTALLGLGLTGLLTLWLTPGATLPRATLSTMMPALMPTIVPTIVVTPAPESEELERQHDQEAEEQEAENPTNEPETMPTPTVCAITNGRGQVRRDGFGRLTTTG